jgi:hypothetical protein
LDKIQNLKDENGHKNQTKHDKRPPKWLKMTVRAVLKSQEDLGVILNIISREKFKMHNFLLIRLRKVAMSHKLVSFELRNEKWTFSIKSSKRLKSPPLLGLNINGYH